jgi:predicted small secreted protein
MKKTFLAIYAVVILAGMALTSGCDNTLTSVGNAVIKGNITDSLTNLPVDSVLVTTVPGSSNARTDASGNFIITGATTGTYTITMKKAGWFTKTISVAVSGDTTRVNSKILFTNIFEFKNLTVSEYFDDNSWSAVNLLLGQVIQELNSVNKDMQMRDSVGLGERFLFRSGDQALDAPGLECRFTDPLMAGRSFMPAEFDTLSRLYPLTGTPDPVNDFPYDRTLYYTNQLAGMRHVYGFYLKGRYDLNPGAPRIYGMFYLNYTAISPTEGQQFLIDVKINKNGENSFSLNQ